MAKYDLKTTGMGALSGAQTGASIGGGLGAAVGTLVPGVGNVVGGAVGTLAGAQIGAIAGGISSLYRQGKEATLSDQQKKAMKEMKKLQKQQEVDARRKEKAMEDEFFLADAGDAVMMMDPTTVYQPQTLGAFKPPKGRL